MTTASINAAAGTTTTIDTGAADPAAFTQTTDTAAAATAQTQADTAADDAVLDRLEGKPAAPADAAAEVKTTDKPAATAKAEPTAESDDPTEGLKIPGTKGKAAAAADPEADRFALAAGRLHLARQGFTDDEIKGMNPERVASFGKAAVPAAEPEPQPAAQVQTGPIDGLDGVLKDLLIEDADAAKLKGVVDKAVQARVQAQLTTAQKELQKETLRAQTAADGFLRLRFQTALRPMLSEMPALKDKATLAKVCDVMDRLDPGGEVAEGADSDAFARLMRESVFAVLGEKSAAATRAGLLTQSKKQASAAPERPIGNANPATKGAAGISEDDLVLDALAAAGNSKVDFERRLAEINR